MKFMIFLVLPFFLGCAVGPLVSHETARTVGASKHELIGGYGQAGHVLKWNMGLSENLDLGLQWETLSLGARTKYAFINQSSLWSFAGAVGIGSSLGGEHVYGDLLGSYLWGPWEPYGTLRIVHVRMNTQDLKDANTGHTLFQIQSFEYNYGQLIVGTRYWITNNWIFSLEASTLISTSSEIKFLNAFLVGAALGYRFE